MSLCVCPPLSVAPRLRLYLHSAGLRSAANAPFNNPQHPQLRRLPPFQALPVQELCKRLASPEGREAARIAALQLLPDLPGGINAPAGAPRLFYVRQRDAVVYAEITITDPSGSGKKLRVYGPRRRGNHALAQAQADADR